MNVQQNSKDKNSKEIVSLSAIMNDFLRKYRVVVFGLFVAGVIAVVGVGVFSIVNNASLQASAAAVERITKAFDEWSSATDDAKKTELEKVLFAELDATSKSFAGAYAGIKAGFVRGEFFVQKKNYAEAEKAFTEVHTKHPTSPFAPAALRNAASAALEALDTTKAIERLAALVKEYPAAVGLDHDLFLLGRLYEGTNDRTKAQEQYELLVSSMPDSEFTKLAKDRIIFLASSGQ